jgi:hypothetical protein
MLMRKEMGTVLTDFFEVLGSRVHELTFSLFLTTLLFSCRYLLLYLIAALLIKIFGEKLYHLKTFSFVEAGKIEMYESDQDHRPRDRSMSDKIIYDDPEVFEVYCFTTISIPMLGEKFTSVARRRYSLFVSKVLYNECFNALNFSKTVEECIENCDRVMKNSHFINIPKDSVLMKRDFIHGTRLFLTFLWQLRNEQSKLLRRELDSLKSFQ